MARTRVVALVTAAGLALPGIVAAAAWSVGVGAGAQGISAAGALAAPGSGSTSAATASKITLTWSAPSGPLPTGYQVFREGTLVSSGGCGSSTTSVSTSVTCDDTGLVANTTYHYQVKAVRNNWTGPFDTQFQGTTTSNSTSISALTLANKTGGTAGTVEAGDSVQITFSGGLKVSTICSVWSGDNSNQSRGNATVHIAAPTDDSHNDVLSVSAWSGCTNYNIGSIDLGDTGYVTSSGSSNKPLDFTGSTIAYDATAHKITITLGTAATGGGFGSAQNVASSTASLTVAAGLQDINGNAISPTTFATGKIQQF